MYLKTSPHIFCLASENFPACCCSDLGCFHAALSSVPAAAFMYYQLYPPWTQSSFLFSQELKILESGFFFQWLLHPLLGPDLFFSSVVIFNTDGRALWSSDKPVARPLPIHRTTQTQNKRIHTYPCLEWESNPRFQRPS
jgi:hypothetical protein